MAAVSRLVLLENSMEMRADPYEEFDEMLVTPCTRDTALSMTAVICESMLSGVAPA